MKEDLAMALSRKPTNQRTEILGVNINSKHHQKDTCEGSILKLDSGSDKEWRSWQGMIGMVCKHII